MEWLKSPPSAHPLKMLAMKLVPSLTSDVLEAALNLFPQLVLLDLVADVMPETRPITDALNKKPGMVTVVNDCVYFNSSLKAADWFKMEIQFGMRKHLGSSRMYEGQRFFKKFVGVSYHDSGVPVLSNYTAF